MKRFLVPLALLAVCLAPNAASAKGGTIHLLVPHSTASTFAHAIPASDVLAGCGHGRYRDPATQRCRGPGDVRY